MFNASTKALFLHSSRAIGIVRPNKEIGTEENVSCAGAIEHCQSQRRRDVPEPGDGQDICLIADLYLTPWVWGAGWGLDTFICQENFGPAILRCELYLDISEFKDIVYLGILDLDRRVVEDLERYVLALDRGRRLEEEVGYLEAG